MKFTTSIPVSLALASALTTTSALPVNLKVARSESATDLAAREPLFPALLGLAPAAFSFVKGLFQRDLNDADIDEALRALLQARGAVVARSEMDARFTPETTKMLVDLAPAVLPSVIPPVIDLIKKGYRKIFGRDAEDAEIAEAIAAMLSGPGKRSDVDARFTPETTKMLVDLAPAVLPSVIPPVIDLFKKGWHKMFGRDATDAELDAALNAMFGGSGEVNARGEVDARFTPATNEILLGLGGAILPSVIPPVIDLIKKGYHKVFGRQISDDELDAAVNGLNALFGESGANKLAARLLARSDATELDQLLDQLMKPALSARMLKL
jgi:hypothetical protein